MKLVFKVSRLPLFLLAIGGLLYWGFIQLDDYAASTRGMALGPHLPILATAEVPPHGVNAALQNEDEISRQASLDLLRAGGYNWVRQEFPWRDIEPAKGDFRWTPWDNLVNDYLEHGMRVLAVLDQPPDWSRLDNNWPNRPSDRLEDYGTFVAAFAARYKGQVDYLQIWDEPNVFPNWGNRPVDPTEYGGMLRVAYQSAKQANPDAVVLLGGLAPNGEPGGRNMSDLLFLDALYQAGAGRFFDVAAAKPYGLWHAANDRVLESDSTSFGRVAAWREIMVARGDEAKPIWAVEFGWNSLPANWDGPPSPWGNTTPEVQAAQTVAALARARAEWPWLPVLFLEGYSPTLPTNDPRTGFSLADASGRPRPVYDAVRSYTVEIVAGVGFHTPSAAAVQRTGGWQTRDAYIIGGPNETMILRFYGTRLDLQVLHNKEGGVATVTIDGRPANRLPKIDGQAWLDTAGRPDDEGRVTVADHLVLGSHILELGVLPRRALWPRGPDVAGSLDIVGFFAVRDRNYGALPWISLALVAALAICAHQAFSAGRNWPWPLLAGRLVKMACYPFVIAWKSAGKMWRGTSDAARDWLSFGLLALVVGGLYFAPLPLACLLGLIAVIVIAMRPASAAYALIATAPLMMRPLHFGNVQVTSTEVVAVVAGIVVAIRLVVTWCRQGVRLDVIAARRWLGSGFTSPILLFVAASVVSTVFASHQREAFREMRGIVLEPLVLYVLVLTTRRRPARGSGGDFVARSIDVLVLVGVAVAIIGLFQYAFTQDVITAEGVRRLRAFYESPNNAALFLGRIIPPATCIALADARRRWYALALVPLLCALVLTFSVGAYLGIVAAVLFVALLRGRRFAVATASGVCAALGGLFLVFPQRLVSHLSLDQGTSSLRLSIWQSALAMIRDHPLVGVGPDNFLRLYREQYIRPEAWREPNLSHPHNLVLDFWLTSGFFGLLALSWLILRFFRVGLDLYHALDHPAQRAIALGLIAMMIDFVIHGLVDNSLFVADLAIVFWLGCALLEVLRREHYNVPSVL